MIRQLILVLATLLPAALVAACGDKVGDSCSFASDCASDGSRICDSSQPEGYCTVLGCDYNTCPEDSVCVRYFTGSFANRPCEPATEDVATDMCSLAEYCEIDGRCAPLASEIRYCMATCGSDGDCREGYECRTLELMRAHGGEPVLEPGLKLGSNPQRFCAEAPVE
jgi:hypothetical protein